MPTQKLRRNANMPKEKSKFCLFTLATDIEVLRITTGMETIALALCIRLDSTKLESDATSGTIATKVFADI